MKNYDKEYFFILKEDDESLPSLTATEETMARQYTFELPPPNSGPFFFFNGAKDSQDKKRIKPITNLPDVLFNGSYLVVRNILRDKLIDQEIPGIYVHPAVYIDDKDQWHEEYWFIGFFDRFDCWDRNNSDYNPRPLELGGFTLFSVYDFSLDSKIMEATPLKERLIFKMGGSQDAFVVCHEIVARIFAGEGTRLVAIENYGDA